MAAFLDNNVTPTAITDALTMDDVLKIVGVATFFLGYSMGI